MLQSLGDLKELLSLYYFIHAATILLYWPLRQNVLLALPDARLMFRAGSGTMTEEWLTQEQEYLFIACVFFFFKCRKVATLQQVVEKGLVFGKLFAIAVLLKLQLVVWGGAYCFLCALVSTMVPPPVYGGADAIEDLTAVEFAGRVRNPEASEDKKTVWLVVFQAEWATKCTALAPLFAKLSVAGPSDARRKWGRVDLVRFPDLAHEFSIEASDPWKAKQLPTVIMFYGGKELRRLPVVGASGTVLECNFGEAEVRKFFMLDKTSDEIRAARKEAIKQRRD